MAASVYQLQRGDDVIRGVVDIEHRAVRAAQRFRQHEGQLHLNAWDDKAVGGDIAAVMEEHIVQQGAVIWLADLRAGLHRLRSKADLVAFQGAAFGDFQAYPFALDGVGVVNGDLRVIQRDRADLLPGLFRLMQAMGNQGVGLFVEHGDILWHCIAGWRCAYPAYGSGSL